MDIFIVVVIFTLLSDVNTFYMLQPPDITTAFPLGIPHKTETSSTVHDSQLENTQNNSKSVGFPKVGKDTNEKVPALLFLLSLAKMALLDNKSKNNLMQTSVKNTSTEKATVFIHAQSSKQFEDVEIFPKNLDSPSSNKSPFNINSSNSEEERKMGVIETSDKNVESSLSINSPPKGKEEERKFEVVETATINLESSISFNKPSRKDEVERKMEVLTTKNVEPSFPYEILLEETPRKVEVFSDTVNVEPSLSPRLSKNNSKIVQNGDNINKKVLGTELLHNSSNEISEKDSQLIVSTNNCVFSSSLCVSSHVCRYLLVIAGSWFYYHTVKTFW